MLVVFDILKFDLGEKGMVENELNYVGVLLIMFEFGWFEVFDLMMIMWVVGGIVWLMVDLKMVVNVFVIIVMFYVVNEIKLVWMMCGGYMILVVVLG